MLVRNRIHVTGLSQEGFVCFCGSGCCVTGTGSALSDQVPRFNFVSLTACARCGRSYDLGCALGNTQNNL